MRFLFLISLLFAAVGSESTDWRTGVVRISAEGRSPGTGLVVAVRDGRAYIVTLPHVVAGDPQPKVTFQADPDWRPRPYRVEVRDAGVREDSLALLIVDSPPQNVLALEPVIDTSVQKPIDVEVAGYPVALTGRFVAQHASIVAVQGTDLVLLPATEEGFSGGPVMLAGRVAGVVFQHTKWGFAVPSAIVQTYLKELNIRWGLYAATSAERLVAPRSANEPLVGTVRKNEKDGQMYVWIAPGQFRIGCSGTDPDCSGDEQVQVVTIPHGYWMGQTEVTQAAYKQVFPDTRLTFKFNGPKRPVENVNWKEADQYCGKLGLRLPTEEEWEYAARAGDPNARYGKLGSIAWYGDNSGTHEVQQKDPNRWGLYDMLGNVWEWTADLYAGSQSPLVRGGAWDSDARFVRVSYRNVLGPTYRDGTVGFRCVGELP